MRSMQNRLAEFYQMFTSLPCGVFHNVRSVSYPFLVWSEHGEDGYASLHTGNHKTEQVITGVVDYYTRTEFDKTVDEIQEILDNAEKVAWELEAVQYEDETGLMHYTWEWRLS